MSEHYTLKVESCPQCGNIYLPDASYCRKCGRERGVEAHVEVPLKIGYVVSNLHLKADSPGLHFFAEKKLEDHCKTGKTAHWSTHILGIDEGDGWLRVESEDGVYYLPTKINGHDVVIQETFHEAPEPAHETEQDIHTTAHPEEHHVVHTVEEHHIVHTVDVHTIVTTEPQFHDTHHEEHAPQPSEEAHHDHPVVQHVSEETHQTHHAPAHPSEEVHHVQERDLAPHPSEEAHHAAHDHAAHDQAAHDHAAHDKAHAEELTNQIRAPQEAHKPMPAPLATAASTAAAAAAAAAKAYAIASNAQAQLPMTGSTALPSTGLTLPGTGTTAHGGDAAAGNDPSAHTETDACLPAPGARPVVATNEIMFAYVQTLGRRVEEAINTVTRDMITRMRALEERPDPHWQVQELNNRLNKVELLTKKLAEKAFKLLSANNLKKDEDAFGRCIQKAHQQVETEKVQGMEKDMAKLAAQVGSRLEVLEATWERHFASDVCHRLDELEHNCKHALAHFHSELESMRDSQPHEMQEIHTIEAFLGHPKSSQLAIAGPTELHDAPEPLQEALQATMGSINTEMDQYRAEVGSLQDAVSRVIPEVLELRHKVDGSDAVRMGDTVMELHHKIEELGADLQKFGMVQEAATEICNMQRAARQVRDSVRESTSTRDVSQDTHLSQNVQAVTQNMQNVTTMLRDVEARVDRHETRLERRMAEITEKLMPLQDFVEQQRLTTYTVSRQVPDLAKKVDQLWTQCQTHFTKIKEHDIHMNFVRNSMESHKQHALDLWPSSRGKPVPSGNSDVDELEQRLLRSNGAAPPPTATTPAESASTAKPLTPGAWPMPPPKSDRPKERPSIFE